MHVRTVGIVGYGSFGKLLYDLIKRFAPDVQIRVHSSRRKPDDTTFFSLTDVAKSDAVIIAAPIHAFEETLSKILPLAPKDTVIVDVATVKVHTVKVLERLAAGRRYIATHPMWGPESYAKEGGHIAGFRIVICEHTLDIQPYGQLCGFLRRCGFVIVEKSAGEHDKLLARTLFLTHLVARIVERGGFKRTDVDTVSFGFLMDAVESVRSVTELFADVYRFNPYCKGVLEQFNRSESEVRKLLEKGQ